MIRKKSTILQTSQKSTSKPAKSQSTKVHNSNTINNDDSPYRATSYNALEKYIRNIQAMNKATAYEYQFRLTTFARFISNGYNNITLDHLITKLKKGSEDPYNILSNYVLYLQNNY